MMKKRLLQPAKRQRKVWMLNKPSVFIYKASLCKTEN
jgi:hypothetical protein